MGELKTITQKDSIKNTIDRIGNGKDFLPVFQRDFVWKKQDIIDLYESILKKYPIGSLILWESTGNEIEREHIDAFGVVKRIHLYKNRSDSDEKDRIITHPAGKTRYRIILDGQQRLTSLFLTTKGDVYKRNGTTKLKLCYDLSCYDTKENVSSRFLFVEEGMADRDNYYYVGDILNSSETKFLKSIEKYDRKYKADLMTLRKAFWEEDGPLTAFVISDCNYEEALDVFVKVNSTGTKLSKTQLLMSCLTSDSDNKYIKKEIKNLISKINYKGRFGFDEDFLMHLCLVLVSNKPDDRRLSLHNISERADDIKKSWKKIAKAASATAKKLQQIGFWDACISSYNAIIPVCYYGYKAGFKELDSNEIKQFLMRCMLKNIFGSGTDTVIDKCITVVDGLITNKKFTWKAFDNNDIELEIYKKDIEALMKNKKGIQTRNVLYYLQMDADPYGNGREQDHLHPKARFDDQKYPYPKEYVNKNGVKKKMTDATKKKWQVYCDTLPNLDMLVKERNTLKLKTKLVDWMKKTPNYRIKFDPGVSYEFEYFEKFYFERKKLMEQKLYELFDVKY